MTTYTYYPKGTCSKQMEVDLEDGVIKDVRVLGGCNGNLKGRPRTPSSGCAASAAASSRPPAPTSSPSRWKRRWRKKKTQSESHRPKRACVDGKGKI